MKSISKKVLIEALAWAGESIVITDSKGKITFVNDAFCTLTGFSRRDVLGRPPSLWSSKSHPRRFYENMWKTIKSKKVWGGEVVNRKKNGEVYTAILSIGPVLHKNKISAFIGIHTDITKQKQQEKKLLRLSKALKRISILDPLTKIYNRRHFDLTIEKEWRDALRNKLPLTIAVIDVDFFKKYNDHFGHLKGDSCLKSIAKLISSCIQRPRDLAARYGGEEFVLLLPNTPSAGGLKVAQDICLTLHKQKLSHPHSSVSKYVTISVGISTLIPKRRHDWLKLLDQADQALYKAKASGRNQIKCYKA